MTNTIFEAISGQDYDGVKVALSKLENLNIKDKGDKGFTPFAWAITEGQPAMVEIIVQEYVKKNQTLLEEDKNQYSGTSLNIALLHDNIDLLNNLLKLGVKPNAEDPYKQTPLFLSIVENRTDYVKILLEHGANPNGITPSGEPLLSFAIDKQFFDIATTLLQNGANLAHTNTNHRTLMAKIRSNRGFLESLQNELNKRLRVPEHINALTIAEIANLPLSLIDPFTINNIQNILIEKVLQDRAEKVPQDTRQNLVKFLRSRIPLAFQNMHRITVVAEIFRTVTMPESIFVQGDSDLSQNLTLSTLLESHSPRHVIEMVLALATSGQCSNPFPVKCSTAVLDGYSSIIEALVASIRDSYNKLGYQLGYPKPSA